ncbi:Rieske (2Fe-2S) iron-sulfur domain protein [Crinalium epipsammum PCC 9333]|uniref:Rieske (2Fe-2S) iron-sulfur domain protein n=1 Tax=Crinalium epipsammum PCC 9333 TaxID=1173022 RepID=K9W1U2_9CYAN|nr:ubiquinol-cytochrome c reductase iron-sulfur subunit [Crinalium epipsammum]AFZ14338.1 Rieske (2Fe-2S) iron-sulfur domain protein [Crinalium epipsammum PCC 9333]
MNRRAFLNWVGVGFLASSLPVAIAGCISDQSDQQATTPTQTPSQRPDGFEQVGTVADLNSKGQILQKQSPEKAVLVVRDPKDANKILAVNPTCSHKACIIGWQADQSVFICPCHNSKFTPDGKFLNPPANKPLQVYQAKIEGEQVLVKQG